MRLRSAARARPQWRVLIIAFGAAALAAMAAAPATAMPLDRAGGTDEPQVVQGAGKIRPFVREFRALLGPNNGDGAATTGGRREINWDGVPDEFAAPNALPADFFDARGAILQTPGQHVSVSADDDNPDSAAPRFGNVNPAYAGQFKTFSAERLFSPIGSNVVNLTFVVPGTDTPALVRGFGAVYTDVDREKSASFEYFARDGRSLGRFSVPPKPSGLSFLGVVFDQAVVARVKIAYGNRRLGRDESAARDVAVMDDFIFGEPVAA